MLPGASTAKLPGESRCRADRQSARLGAGPLLPLAYRVRLLHQGPRARTGEVTLYISIFLKATYDEMPAACPPRLGGRLRRRCTAPAG